jgi:L-arabinokinase
VIAVYVSGHGYGHATRVGEVLRALRASAPECALAVVSEAPESLFRAAIPGDFLFRSVSCDVGLSQKDALRIDLESTRNRLSTFYAGYEALVAAEAVWLRAWGAKLVLGDIPPLAFAAADAAGIRSAAVANFSWDWVYAHLGLETAAHAAATDYAHAHLLLRLPFAAEFSAFARVRDVPLVARRPSLSRETARARLGLDRRPAVLLSFGGIGLADFDARVLEPLSAHQFVLTEPSGTRAPHIHRIGHAELRAAGMEYIDLVAACDVVVSKPGYGIVSDAIAAGAHMIYTDRGDFPEYPIMVNEMPRYLSCVHVSNEALLAGDLGDALRDVLAQTPPALPNLSGADVVAQALLTYV